MPFSPIRIAVVTRLMQQHTIAVIVRPSQYAIAMMVRLSQHTIAAIVRPSQHAIAMMVRLSQHMIAVATRLMQHSIAVMVRPSQHVIAMMVRLIRLTPAAVLPGLLVIIASGSPAMAQNINEQYFTRYTQQDGLSHNVITGMLQDSTGYIWLSTYSGLNRYNGSNFVQMRNYTDSARQPSEYIRGLKWLDDHRMAAYSSGAQIIDTRTGETRDVFIPYPDKKFQYKFNGIRAMKGCPGGDLYVLSYSGFYHFDKDYKLVFRYDHYRKDEIRNTTFSFGRSLHWLDDKRLLVVATAGLYVYNTETRVFKKMEVADCPLFAGFLNYTQTGYCIFQPQPGRFVIINSLAGMLSYVDLPAGRLTQTPLPRNVPGKEFGYRTEFLVASDSLMYVTGHQSGMYAIRFSPGTREIRLIPHKYFAQDACRVLFQDRDHNLWIATSKGLLRQDNRLSYVSQRPIPEGLMDRYPNIAISAIHASDDKIYVATRGEGGLLVYDKASMQFQRRIELGGFGRFADNVYSLLPQGDTSILVGPNGPLLSLNLRTDRVTKIPLDKWVQDSDWVADIQRDRDRNIWIASGRLYRLPADSHRFSIFKARTDPMSEIQEVNSIREDAQGNIWVGGHGLYRYNKQSGDFDLLVDSFPYIKIPDRRIMAFVTDQRNNLWFNGYNNGLICYNPSQGIKHHFTTANGLPDNNIASMIVVGEKLWIASYSGICCMDLSTFRITSFGREDGFPDLPITVGSKFFFDVALNKLYIGFSNTLVAFDPDIIFRHDRDPELFIERLAPGQQKALLYPGKEVTISWRDNNVLLTIGTINFFTSASTRYAYRCMKEESTPWEDLGTSNLVNMSGLSPGHHCIEVKMYSLNNRWPAQVCQIFITVLPPWWLSSWFITICVILSLIAVGLLIRWRTRLARKKEQAKTHIQALKAEEYKNQFELEQISNYFSSTLANKKNVDEVLWDVARNLIGRMKYDDCMIYLWNEDHTRMVQKASYGPKGDPKAIRESTFDVAPGQGVVGSVMQTWEPLLIPDTRKDFRYRVDDITRLSEICVPIIHNNELIGIIDSEHPEKDYYKERDLQILTTIATLVGNKIKQIESEHTLEIKKREIATINQQLAEAQLSALQTQMNPHFIFNSLNSIKGMILENQQQKASRYLSKFAQMIRITLNQSKEAFTTLHENIEHLENYLLMEKLRFDDSFTYRITVDESIDQEETLIPTLMIQPLAENAIWHGLMPKKGEKKLSIRFAMLPDGITCTISDNGIGIRQAEKLKQMTRQVHQSVGLSNLRNRIKIMNEKYDTGCSLEIDDLQEIHADKTGTRVVLTFKMFTTKPCL